MAALLLLGAALALPTLAAEPPAPARTSDVPVQTAGEKRLRALFEELWVLAHEGPMLDEQSGLDTARLLPTKLFPGQARLEYDERRVGWTCPKGRVSGDSLAFAALDCGDPGKAVVVVSGELIPEVGGDLFQLAFALAHELGHVMLQHALQDQLSFKASWEAWWRLKGESLLADAIRETERSGRFQTGKDGRIADEADLAEAREEALAPIVEEFHALHRERFAALARANQLEANAYAVRLLERSIYGASGGYEYMREGAEREAKLIAAYRFYSVDIEKQGNPPFYEMAWDIFRRVYLTERHGKPSK